MIMHDFCSDCGKKYKIIIKEDFIHYICECAEDLYPLNLIGGSLNYFKNVFEPPLCPKCNIQPITDRKDINLECFFCCGKCGLSTPKDIKRTILTDDMIEKSNDWKELVKKTTCDIKISNNAIKHIQTIKDYLGKKNDLYRNRKSNNVAKKIY